MKIKSTPSLCLKDDTEIANMRLISPVISYD